MSKTLDTYKVRNHYILGKHGEDYFLLCTPEGNLLKGKLRSHLERDFSSNYDLGSYVINRVVAPAFSLRSSRLTIDKIAKKLFVDSFPEPESLSASGFSVLGVKCDGPKTSAIYDKAKPLGPE